MNCCRFGLRRFFRCAPQESGGDRAGSISSPRPAKGCLVPGAAPVTGDNGRVYCRASPGGDALQDVRIPVG